ncbi:MAG TPA: DUF4271 domain-containing protein [Puia sp.]|nr:DUF4271 domain-containing protein [Puia sp.]
MRSPGTSIAKPQDTTLSTPRHDSLVIVKHLSHRDSVRRDSIARVRRAVRDSMRRVQNKVREDSLAAAAAMKTGVLRPGVTSAAASTPTTTPKPDSIAAAKPVAAPPGASTSAVSATSTASATSATPKTVPEGPPMLSYWQKVMSSWPGFNFTGKPVVEIYEIHRTSSKDSFFYLLVAILFYFALVRIFFEKYFNNLMTLFFRVSLRQQQIREQVLQTPLPSLLLNILFIVSGGLYACSLLHNSPIGEGIGFWVLYGWCMLILAVIYLVKFMVLKFVGWVFSISRATDIYIFVVFLVNKMLGIFLLPFLILITFSGDDARGIFTTISMTMVVVLWIYRALAAYRPVRNEIKLTPFYFFLYLCAFEIAPLLLIYKVLLTYLEKVY